MSANLDVLFDSAMSNYSAVSLQKLYQGIKSSDSPADYSELLGMLFEAWDNEDGIYDELQANFTIQVLMLKAGDSAVFRRALNNAVKKLLPPYLSKSGLIRTLGLSDSSISLHEALRRYHNLLSVNNNTLAFLSGTARWGIISNVDALAGTLTFDPLAGTGPSSIPLNKLLSEGTMFTRNVDSQRLSAMSGRALGSGTEYRKIAYNRALSNIDDEHIEMIARATHIPQVMGEEEFVAWWSNTGSLGNSATAALRGSCKARSLQEMNLLLEKELASGNKEELTEEQLESYKQFFVKISPALILRESKQFGQVILQLSSFMNDEQLKETLSCLETKCSFLPANIDGASLEVFAPLGDMNVKVLAKVFAALCLFMPVDYMATLCGRMPLKAMNVLAELLDDEDLLPALEDAPVSADLYMYIWKNRAKRTSALLGVLTIGNVVKVLNQSRLPKAWQSAARDLKTTLMDKADFQGFLLESAGKDVKLITSALQAAHVLASGERQSLLVKFSRLDRSMQEHIESGIGQKLVRDANKDESSNVNEEPMYSSVASIKRLRLELEDIVNVQQPENREALKTARAHGDFRENSEFDAAKERRNFLSRRRSDLERILGQVLAVNFSDVAPALHAVVGSTVTLDLTTGEQEIYYLLGAWDGNPEKSYLSYKTRLGEAIYNHEVGTQVELPGGKSAVLAKVEVLPAEVIAEMDA